MRAFPTDEYMDEQRVGQHPGMDLRDFFAAHVACGYHASMRYNADDDVWPNPGQVAAYAYEVADAMVEASRKRKAKA